MTAPKPARLPCEQKAALAVRPEPGEAAAAPCWRERRLRRGGVGGKISVEAACPSTGFSLRLLMDYNLII